MAITNKEEGVWGIDKVFDKQNEGVWGYDTTQRQLWVWGRNGGFGNLGQNNRTDYSSPRQVLGDTTEWKYVYSDGETVGATKNDGTFWVWGRNGNNQMGIGTPGSRSSPVQLPGTNWPTEPGKVTFAGMHSAAIKTDGTLWTWGFNSAGRLGHNQANTSYSSPKQVGSDTNWKTVSITYEGTFATKTDGTAWSWGWNNNGGNGGILGQNNQTQYSSPRQIPGTTWNHVQTSGNTVLATKTDGTLWCWGSNTYGMLGLSQSSNNLFESSPKQIGSDTTWSKSADKIRTSSRYNAGCMKTDGTLWTWGRNDYGQLGHNSKTDRSSPRQVGSNTTWSQFSTRHDWCLGLKTDGTIWTWGRNHQGQLGQSNLTEYSSPRQLGSDTAWSQVQIGKEAGHAIKDI